MTHIKVVETIMMFIWFMSLIQSGSVGVVSLNIKSYNVSCLKILVICVLIESLPIILNTFITTCLSFRTGTCFPKVIKQWQRHVSQVTVTCKLQTNLLNMPK